MKVNTIRAVILAIAITGGILMMTLKGEAVEAEPDSQIKQVSHLQDLSESEVVEDDTVSPIKKDESRLQELSECEDSIINNYNQKYTNIVCKYAKEYSVSAKQIANIINCENRGWNPTLQSGIRYKKDYPTLGIKAGELERSYGLSQIHLPAHPHITYEQATNPDFAIEFMAKALSEGKGTMWTCYR